VRCLQLRELFCPGKVFERGTILPWLCVSEAKVFNTQGMVLAVNSASALHFDIPQALYLSAHS
jgi:hypothetical protein